MVKVEGEGTVSTPHKAAILGHPSYVWRFGQERRLGLIRRFVSLENKRILDIGCGIGTYVHQLRRFSPCVYGVDVDAERVAMAKRTLTHHILQASAEDLPFQDGAFDIALLHEVIEHVPNDHKAMQEAHRVIRPGGHIVVYAPNRLYPLETHGIYLGRRYIFRLAPFVGYLPDRWRRMLAPHVRSYRTADIKALFRGMPISLITHTYVFPGFDKIAAKRTWVAHLLRKTTYFLEKTPLRIFGLSHFLVVRKEAHG
ncbi:MAG: class I SAM-dependent methyltransferase [Chloroflexi bacterium]|nr:class I SAM-dependent methyltransferase [Chloroflexota bacterium]